MGGGGLRGSFGSNYGGGGLVHNRLEPFVLLLAGITMVLVWLQDWSLMPPDRGTHPSLLFKATSTTTMTAARDSTSTAARTGSQPFDDSFASAVGSNASRPENNANANSGRLRPAAAAAAAAVATPKERDSTDSMDPADKPPEAVAADLLQAAAAEARAEAASAAATDSEATPSTTTTTTATSDSANSPDKRGKSSGRQPEPLLEPPVSPYEQRWPTYKLPFWASKPYFFRRKVAHGDHNATHPTPNVCFVHVGKAAGSSVGCSLGFQLHCSSEYVYPPGRLPAATTNLMHNDVNDCALDMQYYMFTLRHPVERIKSWFLYDWKMLGKVRNSVEDGGCGYGSINALAEIGLAPQPNSRTSKDCHKLAVRVIRGEEKVGNHAYHNYRYYLNQVPSNASLTVIRAEHMLDDWNAMERLLQSGQVVHRLPSKNENKKYQPEDKYVSAAGVRHLCAALCDEIQVYKHILHLAVNLPPSQVEESIQELRQTCPTEVDQSACPR